MNNTETLRAITENLNTILETEGLHLVRENYENAKNVPSSIFPYGVISYDGETFEYTHGQRPGYSDVDFSVKVVLRNKDLRAMTDDEQRWAHRIRKVLTVNAINSGLISATSPVSRVITRSVTVEKAGYVSRLIYSLSIRYR
ncbi:MAG: hypothetical protein ACE5DW_00715 [Thermodesulfobacteriota bacterium]